ncbi:hypothetical protein V8F33_004870 [Rhypophila sp. PSN 637]
MNFTRALQALKRITWRYPTHHAADGRRPEAESLVQTHYNDHSLRRYCEKLCAARGGYEP